MQKQKHHQKYQQKGFNQSAQHFVDGGVEKVVGVLHFGIGHASGKVLGGLGHHLLHIFDYLRGVGTGHLINGHTRAGMSHAAADDIARKGVHLNARHIAKAECFAARLNGQNNIFVVDGVGEAAGVAQHVLKGLLGVFAKLARRGFDVLLGQGRGDVGGLEFVFGHHIGA